VRGRNPRHCMPPAPAGIAGIVRARCAACAIAGNLVMPGEDGPAVCRGPVDRLARRRRGSPPLDTAGPAAYPLPGRIAGARPRAAAHRLHTREEQTVEITDVRVDVFTYRSRIVRDSEGHTHPGEEHEALNALLTVTTDDGAEGYCFGSPDGLRPYVIDRFIRPNLIGQDPFDREKIWQNLVHWQRLGGAALSDRVLAVVEMALWDLAGRRLGLPVHKLLGAYRDRVPAYGSTMCGDELPGGLATPEDYARFAEWLVRRGYRAIKLHTWMPPVSFAPDVKMDVKAAAAVREAVGPDIELMVDAYHYYSREDALRYGRALQELGYYWFEEPMAEHSTSSYAWLAEQLDIPVLGPEVAEGKMFTRAEWIVRRACDMTRAGVGDVGGIIPTIKTAHLAEAHGMACEIHGGGAGNLSVLGAIPNGRWYERGLLHPFIDYDETPPWLNSPIDPMDDEGFVPMPSGPGLGEDINFDYVRDNPVDGG